MAFKIELNTSTKGSKMPGKIKQVKRAIKILEIANAVYKLLGANGHIKDIKEGPKVYSCDYSLDNPEEVDLGKLMKNLGGNLAKIGNKELTIDIAKADQEIVSLSSLLSSQEFKKTKNTLPVIFGVDTVGKPMILDLLKMPHILVGGQTGSGKSTLLKSVYESLTRKLKSSVLKFLIIDSKNTDFAKYKNSQYLLKPVVNKPEKGLVALEQVVDIMNERYAQLRAAKVKNIQEYQKKHKDMPYIIVMVDELSDLMAQNRREVESCIQQIAQKSRATGIHMIIATRDLSKDNVSNLIKANLPTVVAFKTRDKSGSVRMLGEGGAEKLLNYGDILLSEGGRVPVRMHPAYVR